MTTTTQGASAELLPCPFCKSEVSNSGKLMHEIDCYIMRPSEAAWNRRAAQPAAPVVPEGYVLVPKEPTEAMVHAAEDLPAPRMFGKVYRAMLAASPQVEVAQPRPKPGTVQNLLHWALRELFDAMPEHHDWLSPRAETVLRAVRGAGPIPAEPVQVEVVPQAEQVAPGDKSAPKDIWQACEWIAQLRARVDSLLAIINANPERAAAPAQQSSAQKGGGE